MIRRVFRAADPNIAGLLAEGDKEAEKQFGGPADRVSQVYGVFLKVAWTKRLQAKLEADIPRIQSAQVIARALVEKKQMSITGASHASMSLKQMLADRKAKIAAAHDKLAANMNKLDEATMALDSLGNDVGSEAADLMASIGQFKNDIG